MSKGVEPELVTITINDVELKVPKGELIVESVKRLGLEIPIFCYHPRMKPVGMCRMCLVEVGFKQPDGTIRKMPKPQAGCTLPASEGMAIFTDTEQVHKDRKGVLEFLLMNHPLDCPICDRGGECPLQNNTIFYGPSTSRFNEIKRHAHKAYPLSAHVTLDLERCIQCGRCVRFTEEISGDSQLAFRFRGSSMQPSTFKLTDFDSKFSGNTIEICPVGALTSSNYRFRARPWDLESSEGICLECSNHCNVWFDHRSQKFVRINGRINEAVNEEWTCDRGKFGHEYYNSDERINQVMIRQGRQFVAGDWSDAYDLILPQFQDKGDGAAFLAGGRTSNEALYLLSKFAKEAVKTPNIDSNWSLHPTSDFGTPASIASLESAPTIIVFGTLLADELPMIYLRTRKSWSAGTAKVIQISATVNEVSSFAELDLRCRPGAEHLAALGIALAANVAAKHAGDASELSLAEIAQSTGIREDQFQAIAASLTNGAQVIASDQLQSSDRGIQAQEILAEVAAATNVKFNCYPTRANQTGARCLGITPGTDGKSVHEILEACREFKIFALWLVDVDPFQLCENRRLVQDALEHVDFLVVQSTTRNEATEFASVILPSAAPAEQTGTYTNCEGRVQAFKQVIPAPNQAKAGWRIFAEVLLRSQSGTPYFSPGEVLAEIESKIPAWKGVSANLAGEGHLLTNSAKEVAAKS